MMHTKPTPELFGRDTELASVRALIEETTKGGASLVFYGDAGLGKSALLDAAERDAAAEGIRIVRSAGIEFEADISFAGLNQILLPLRRHIADLEPALRDGLCVALGLAAGSPPARLLVSNAVLALMTLAASHRPLLAVVDDMQWLDRVSAQVLAFVARSSSGRHFGFLGAARTEDPGMLQLGDLPTQELRTLSDGAARTVIDSVAPGLAPSVRARVLEEACGNPLAIEELAASLDPGQRSGSAALPPVLRTTSRLTDLFAARIRRLPAPSRRALLIAALNSSSDTGVLRAAIGDSLVAQLAPAEEARLISWSQTDEELIFRHPLMRSAVVELATPSDQRAAHRSLAAALRAEPDRRAWHLADAAVGTNEGVATLMEDVARGAARRGDSAASVNAFIRAAALSPHPADRSRRLGEAAYLGAHAGELATAGELLTAARDADPVRHTSLRDASTAAYLLMAGDGDVDAAHRLLTASIAACPDPDDSTDPELLEALHTLFIVCLLSGRAELWTALHEGLDRLRPAAPEGLALRARLFGDPARATAADLRRLDAEIAELSAETDPVTISRVTITATFVGRLAACRESLWRVVRYAQSAGVAIEANALRDLALGGFMSGRWEEAERLATLGLERADEHGPGVIAGQFEWILGLLAAVRGDHRRSQAFSDRLMRWSSPRRAFGFMHFAHQPRVLSAIADGDWEQAYRDADAISPAGELASHVGAALWVCMDLVEAAVRTDRLDEARAHVAAIQKADIAAISPHLALLAAGAAAMTAEEGAAAGLYEQALAIPHADRWPFDRTRVQLAYGEHLRRLRAHVLSRTQLSAAMRTFQWLGAEPWADRAARELRVAGGMPTTAPVHREHGVERGVLTPQEQQIAQLAAAGLTNKQIAERLFLSHRTVGNHLHRIFPKLGITSRAGLRDALPDALAGEVLAVVC
ncbi:AAA family ATPase [Streptomyces sp. OE57]|uniref:AAA family ATPase n=1 Tax=Streptomyces lacaronensis TaxID=3379885 RepID=UPI0039B78313